jgi:hypothetical protein
MPTLNDPYFDKDSQVTLKNPTSEDFKWSASGKPYLLPAGAVRIYPGYVANLCVKHFVDKMMNEDSKKDPNVEKRMTNWLARAEYADKIIVKEDRVHEEINEGIEMEVDEGLDPDEVKEAPEVPATIEDLEKETKTDEELYPKPKKSNIVEDEPTGDEQSDGDPEVENAKSKHKEAGK